MILVDSPRWTVGRVWKEHVGALKSLRGQLVVVELCVRAGTGALALRLLLGEDRVNLVAAYGTGSNLQGVHKAGAARISLFP